jgi:hypothetical protein
MKIEIQKLHVSPNNTRQPDPKDKAIQEWPNDHDYQSHLQSVGV